MRRRLSLALSLFPPTNVIILCAPLGLVALLRICCRHKLTDIPPERRHCKAFLSETHHCGPTALFATPCQCNTTEEIHTLGSIVATNANPEKSILVTGPNERDPHQTYPAVIRIKPHKEQPNRINSLTNVIQLTPITRLIIYKLVRNIKHQHEC